jgi:glycosyltransferase involved in cell wall biosynthesis
MQTVMYVSGGLGGGGAERRSLQLIQAVTQRYPATRVVVCDVSGERGILADAFADAGIPLVGIGLNAAGLAAFRATIRAYKPHVVHANVGIISGYFMLAAWLSCVPIRISHFRTPEQDPRFTVWARLRSAVGAILTRVFSTDIVGVSLAVRAFARVPDRKWRVLYNGIPLPPQLGDMERHATAPVEILLLGRIHPVKNFELAIDMIEALLETGTNARLHMVGTGSAAELDRLAVKVAGSGARQHIVVHGYTATPEKYLEFADLLILPSAYEGLPGSVLEALSYGVPVVASDLPGLREIAAHTAGVALVALSSPAEVWADEISRHFRRAQRSSIATAFSKSPFVLDQQVAAIAQLWKLAR